MPRSTGSRTAPGFQAEPSVLPHVRCAPDPSATGSARHPVASGLRRLLPTSASPSEPRGGMPKHRGSIWLTRFGSWAHGLRAAPRREAQDLHILPVHARRTSGASRRALSVAYLVLSNLAATQ